MNLAYYCYPKSAFYGRKIDKTAIYNHAQPSAAVKQLFVKQVEKIVWQYKLAPETLNLPSTAAVTEIQVFDIHLKNQELDNSVLCCIDKAIPSPLIFQCHYQNQIKVTACYKRPSEADSEKWVISEYLATAWFANDSSQQPLPVVLDLTALYEAMLRQLIPLATRTGESIKQQLERYEQLQSKQKEHQKLQQRINTERQFNRKVELNRQLKQLKTLIDTLIL
jgi:hypothetical protein